MKYLRAVIKSDERGIIYQKDFQIQQVFGTFSRDLVVSLIISGVMNQGGGIYQTLVIPHYGRFTRVTPQVIRYDPLKQIRDSSEGEKISLEYEEQIDPDKPVAFFSIEVFAVIQAFKYRRNFPLSVINYFWDNIEYALRRIHVLLDEQENVQHLLFARNDEQGEFEREVILTHRPNTAPLVEIVPNKQTQNPLRRKQLSDFAIEATMGFLHGKLADKTPGAGAQEAVRATNVTIMIKKSALEGVQQVARSNAHVELGGMLVGYVYEDLNGMGNKHFVHIAAHLPAERTFASEVELRYTFESWQSQNARLKNFYPDMRIIGWYHTHLDIVRKTYYTDETRTQTFTTPLFFSQDDLFTHRQFFREKWLVAMVLDTDGNLVFYEWADDKIQETQHFYVLREVADGDKDDVKA